MNAHEKAEGKQIIFHPYDGKFYSHLFIDMNGVKNT